MVSEYWLMLTAPLSSRHTLTQSCLADVLLVSSSGRDGDHAKRTSPRIGSLQCKSSAIGDHFATHNDVAAPNRLSVCLSEFDLPDDHSIAIDTPADALARLSLRNASAAALFDFKVICRIGDRRPTQAVARPCNGRAPPYEQSASARRQFAGICDLDKRALKRSVA